MHMTETPMMRQWHSCKKQVPDSVLLFRLGDFYEAFYEDAEVISKAIDLTLTKRQDISMCGVPYHSAENYIDRLLAKGFKVAIAEQMQDPRMTKGIVERKVVKVLSPATLIQSSLIQDKKNNYFVCLTQIGSLFGLSIIDLTTSEFRSLELESKISLLDELYRLKPAELLITESFKEKQLSLLREMSLSFSFVLTAKPDTFCNAEKALFTLKNHFKNPHEIEKIQESLVSVFSSGLLFTYLQEELLHDLSSIQIIQTEEKDDFLLLDRQTMKNLEILEPSNPDSSLSLFDLLDETQTSMGARLLKQWVQKPLKQIAHIKQRQNVTEELLEKKVLHQTLQKTLAQIRDLQRLAIRISSSYVGPRDFISLSTSLKASKELQLHLSKLESPLFQECNQQFFDASSLVEKINLAIHENPPLKASEMGIFKDGYDTALDELRSIRQNSKNWLAQYQAKLKQDFGIKTLKVGFTKVFGYYIEVSKGAAKQMPEIFQRKQTLVNAERFISPELKDFEYKILHAEEKMKAIEANLFQKMVDFLLPWIPKIQILAQAIAKLDVYCSLASIAEKQGYTKPTLVEDNCIEIYEGRHPIIDRLMHLGEFIPNDVHLDQDQQQLMLITGPNMAGKSTFIRQVALIVILAQIGSYVPAKSAKIGWVDRVFSRIGASDDLSRGQSTFMVEMCETAHILKHCTERSLIILDEIGRGTSTYDGISIAWAVAEYLLTQKGKTAKTLFATHYWELTRLHEEFRHALNYQVAVKETADGIVFLHKIIQGGTDKSYGIHVAKLAGLPFEAITTAKKMLKKLETEQKHPKKTKTEAFPLFEVSHTEQYREQLDAIKHMNINELTPMQALQKLFEIQQQIKL